MTATASIEANCQKILQQVQQAAKAAARVLLLPEAALIGYPGAARESLQGESACHIADFEDLIHIRAEQVGLAVVVGSASMHPDGGWSNDAFVCGAVPKPKRYRKQALTPLDHQFFKPGTQLAPVVELDGWRWGLTICYEVRFPSFWGDACQQGVDGFLTIAHMAGPDADEGCKASVVPAHYSSRAAEWASPVVLSNTGADDRWLASGAWDARGLPQSGEAITEDLLVTEVAHRSTFHPWYSQLHQDALKWHRSLR